jgi:succinoglycan biosynthesis protein ExoA
VNIHDSAGPPDAAGTGPRLDPPGQPLPQAPFVSIVLPVRNEEDHIEQCIVQLLEQDYPSDRFEILVVDGCSDDGTRAVLLEIERRQPHVALRVLDNPDRTVPQALNIGIRAARGEVIVRMDGHAVPAQNYITACVGALRRSRAANVGGVLSFFATSRFGAAVTIAAGHRLGAGDAGYRVGGDAGFVDTVPFGAFRRSVFEQVGLFDESMVRNQDYEMNVRIRRVDEQVYLDPAIRVAYAPRSTVRALGRQYFQYGWWRVETLRRHPYSMRLRQVIPPGFVATLLLFALLTPWTVVPLAGLAAIYLSTILAVSFRVAKERSSPLLVALAFMTIHLAFGLGFLLNVVSLGTFPYRAGPPRIPRLEDPA